MEGSGARHGAGSGQSRFCGSRSDANPGLYIALEAPVRPSGDEAETVDREWRQFVANARVARELLAEL